MQALEELDLELRACTICGCTDQVPCPGGCGWAAEGLYSRCAAEMREAAPPYLERPIPRRAA